MLLQSPAARAVAGDPAILAGSTTDTRSSAAGSRLVTDARPDLASLRIDKDARDSSPGWWFWLSLVLLLAAEVLGGMFTRRPEDSP